jgi:hypothetical protein
MRIADIPNHWWIKKNDISAPISPILLLTSVLLSDIRSNQGTSLTLSKSWRQLKKCDTNAKSKNNENNSKNSPVILTNLSDRKISKKLVAGDFGLPDLAVPFPGFLPGSGAASVPSDFSLFAFKAIGSIGLFCNVQNSLHTYMKKALE